MHDPDTDRTAKIELILSMANMLICGEEEAQAGLNKFQDQWANGHLDLPGLRKFMGELHREEVIARDMLKDITTLIDQAISDSCADNMLSKDKSLFITAFHMARNSGTPLDLYIINSLSGTKSQPPPLDECFIPASADR